MAAWERPKTPFPTTPSQREYKDSCHEALAKANPPEEETSSILNTIKLKILNTIKLKIVSHFGTLFG